LVGDHEALGGSGDGDDAAMVGPVVLAQRGGSIGVMLIGTR
jgi:hypothetical protein